MGKVVHFEIPAEDLERAQKFYTDSFGWNVNLIPEFNYSIVTTGPSDEKTGPKEPGFINGGMLKRQDPVQKPVITIEVKDIEAALKQVAAKGGKVTREKKPVGEEGFAAYFEDSEGNCMGLWESTAKK